MTTELMPQSTDGLLKRAQEFEHVINGVKSLTQQPEAPIEEAYPYSTKDLVREIAQATLISRSAAKSRLNNILTRDPAKEIKPKKVRIPGKDGPKVSFFTPEQRNIILEKALLVKSKRRSRLRSLEEEKKPLYL